MKEWGVERHADPLLDGKPFKEVLVDNRANASALSDYQVSLTVDKAHLKFDGQRHLRFVDENMQILDYWAETTDDFWIEVLKIIGSGIVSLKLVEDVITDASGGDVTFVQYHEDLSANDRGANEFAGGHAYRGKVNRNGGNVVVGFASETAWRPDDGVYIYFYMTVASQSSIETRKDGVLLVDNIGVIGDGTYVVDLLYPAGGDIYGYLNDVLMGTVVGNSPTDDMGIWYYERTGAPTLDWGVIRKYSDPEPTTSIGVGM